MRFRIACGAAGRRYLDGLTWTGLLGLDLAVLVELRDVGPEIVDLVFALDAGERHLGAGNLGLRVLDVFLELGLVPGDAGILVGVRIGVALRGAGLAAVEPVQLRPDLVLGAFADGMAGQALVERGLAGGEVDVLRQRARGRQSQGGEGNERAQGRFHHRVLFVFRRGYYFLGWRWCGRLWHGRLRQDKS